MDAGTGPVVVGYDGSDHGRDALLWAAHEAARRRRRLIVVHVAEYQGLGLRGPAAMAREWAKGADRRAAGSR
jgi:nucleotide-binding universal stress UspA family protein